MSMIECLHEISVSGTPTPTGRGRLSDYLLNRKLSGFRLRRGELELVFDADCGCSADVRTVVLYVTSLKSSNGKLSLCVITSDGDVMED